MRIVVAVGCPDEASQIRQSLQSIGFQVECLQPGETLESSLVLDTADLLVVEWQGGTHGSPLSLKSMRERLGRHVPVVFIAPGPQAHALVEALACGGDEFIVRPLLLAEFMARVTALLRRCLPQRYGRRLSSGAYELNAASYAVTLRGRELELKAREFELAWVLFSHVGRILSRPTLIQSVWNGAAMDSRTLDTHVCLLRRKLELVPENGLRLRAIYRRGYLLEEVKSPPVAREIVAAQAFVVTTGG